jgi:hypothetical protein
VGNPYLLNGNITVDDRSTLTIDPGVVVKAASVGLYVNGTLSAQGTADAPIIFTSSADDEVGGDTDNNQDAVLPAPGNWKGIVFRNTTNANKSILANAEIRYATGGYSLEDGTSPTIRQVTTLP